MNKHIHRNGNYGIDAPYAPFGIGFGALVLLVVTIVNIFAGAIGPAVGTGIASAWMWLMTFSYLYTTLRGKFVVWQSILDGLALKGDETLLDMGCGRGAVLLMAAQRLDNGRAHGVDLWLSRDQSGNAMEMTKRNAALEGVADRIGLHTGDMAKLPFPDRQFDAVVSSLAVHNISDPAGRLQAINEAVRVLRPGGRLAIADIRHVPAYATQLKACGTQDIRVRGLGWRFWYGGPWVGTRLVTATRAVG
ncbi:MAG TPA: class I SAM-dependent methyltransferase [Gammaproteobacteria bacterium]|nr:class I SAM-dependent methyltransferase [Gammaproteobacteria bacterium]